MADVIKLLCKEFNLKLDQVNSTIKLIDEGNTIPFIARYRKEQTGSLDDVVLRDLYERLIYLRNLEERKVEIIRLIDEQGKLTEELKDEILKAEVLQRLEDLYRPFKQKKSTRASKAKERGLEPLANIILAQNSTSEDFDSMAADFINEEMEVKNTKDAFAGAMDIIAEIVSDNAEHRKKIREIYIAYGIISSEAVDADQKTVYEMYYKYEEAVKTIVNHRILAINRGEKEKVLKVKLTTPDDRITDYLCSTEIKDDTASTTKFYKSAIEDGYKRLIAPSIDREVRNLLTERAGEEAIKVFGKNTKNLLMISPVKDVNVLAIDPSFRTGCKLAALDGTGKLLDHIAVYPNEPRNEVEKSQKLMSEWIKKYDINIIPIGNGTASRETEAVVADMLSKINKKVSYTIVSEAGASVYSASRIAQEEYPDLDVTIRGAISIGRRLQDPLAELVKIDPKSIGVGQYQHDVNQGKLGEALDGVVEDCVNSVGVDLNTASPALLQYVSGISKTIAKNIVSYREENGKFINRKDLKKIKQLGDKAFEQCAGFLRISDGENPLDKTSVHPESYDIAQSLLIRLGYTLDDVKSSRLSDIGQRISTLKIQEEKKEIKQIKPAQSGQRLKGLEALALLQQKPAEHKERKSAKDLFDVRIKVLADELNVGIPTLTDIVEELKKPGRDVRDEMPKPIFRNDVLKIEDLKEGMVLTGTVRNVVDFGAFVDVGLKNDGLVHLSEMSEKYIKHPMELVQVGDIVSVKIKNIDIQRQRIGLTMK
jgi:uncharacterized protein